MVIRPDGRVGQLLLATDKRPKGLDWRYDVQGKTMLPGIVDAAGALIYYGLQLTGLDLSAAQRMAEVQALVRGYAQAHPEKKWVIGRGWTPLPEAERAALTATALDEAVADRPVVLLSADGDSAWVNSAALKVAGLQVSPADQDSVIAGPAMSAMQRFLPETLPVERDQALAVAQYGLLAAGITAMTDLGTSERDWNSFRRAADSGRLKLRVTSYADNIEGLISIAGARPMAWAQDARLRMIGLGLQLDSSLQSGTAWRASSASASVLELRRIEDTRLRNLSSRAAMDGFQLAIIAHGDAAVEEALNVIDEMVPTYTGDRRWLIHGIVQVNATDLARLDRNDIIVTGGPVFADGNVTSVWGSGMLAVAPDPIAAMSALSRSANFPRIDEARLLASFTSGPAYAAFAEKDFGRLLPGYLADFILLDGDPLAPIAANHPIQVMESWIGGKREWSRK
nr:amidohydrolase family protein [Aquisediminimonas sediminicola]